MNGEGEREVNISDISHCVWCMEQQLSKCRCILSLFSHGNPLIEIFICSDIINKITNEVCGATNELIVHLVTERCGFNRHYTEHC